MTSDQHKDLSIWEALAVLQRQAPVIRKTETVSVETKTGRMEYNFAGLAKVWEAVSGLLEELGFVYSSRPDVMDIGGGQTRFVLRCTLFHIPSRDKLEGTYPLSGDSPQKIGATITFGRRYWFVAALNLIVAEDDNDAQAAEDLANASPSDLAKGNRTPRQTAQRKPARPRQAPPPTEGGQPIVPNNPGAPMTDSTRKKMFASMGELGHSTREEYGEYINRVLVKHGAQPVSSSTELTQLQAGWVIEAAEAALAGPPPEEPGDPAESEG